MFVQEVFICIISIIVLVLYNQVVFFKSYHSPTEMTSLEVLQGTLQKMHLQISRGDHKP